MLHAIGNVLGLGSSYEEQSTGGKLGTLCTVPFKIIWGFVIFMVFAWTASRNGRAFLFGIPAMLFVVGAVAFVWVANNKGTEKASAISSAYYQLASDPLSPFFDRNAALLYAKKMVDLVPEEPRRKYRLGVAYDELEDYQRAHEVMDWLANESQERAADPNDVVSEQQFAGYSDAHFWLATYFLDPEKSDLSDDELRRSKSKDQVLLSYKANPKNVQAVLGLAGIYRTEAVNLKEEAEKLKEEGNDAEADAKTELSTEKTNEAVRYFKEAIALRLTSDRQLYASTAVVEILQEEGRDEEAQLTGLRFINKHEKNARDYPNVLPFWVSIVRTCILLEEFERGENFILQGYQLAQDPEVRQTLAQLKAQIAVEKAKSFTDMDDEEAFLDRLYALANAIKTDVRVPEGYSELMYFVDGFPVESEQDLWLRDSVLGVATADAGGSGIPGVIHIILGLRDIVAGKPKDGQNNWEIAGEQFKLSPFAINYFIQVFAEERELPEDKRNDLISIAIEMFPQSPHFYATRGRYFLEDKNYEKAIEDLEFAAARIPDSLSILGNLVACCTEVSDQEKVDRYQAKIEEIEARTEVDAITAGFASQKQDSDSKEDKK